MGKIFETDVKSTEGITLHSIKSTFGKEKLMGNHWKETDITADDLDGELMEQIKFNQGVLKNPDDATGNRENKQEDGIQDDNVI